MLKSFNLQRNQMESQGNALARDGCAASRPAEPRLSLLCFLVCLGVFFRGTFCLECDVGCDACERVRGEGLLTLQRTNAAAKKENKTLPKRKGEKKKSKAHINVL